jgi:glutamine amidotransferase
MQHIAVIDYGMGNLRSVSKALEAVSENSKVEVTADADKILAASHVVFPGVGAIRDCIAELKRLHLDETILTVAQTKPLLGICLGMQAMLNFSEENGGTETLHLFDGKVKYFDKIVDEEGQALKVPHMGWNQVEQTVEHPLWHNIEQSSRFYFVHSYYVAPEQKQATAGQTTYAVPFTSAIHRDNIFAVQFHPEKSQHVGLQLLKNFINWDGQS